MNMKRILITIGIIFSVMLLVFGAEKTVSYLKATRSSANDLADNNVPVKFELTRVKTLLETEARKISEFKIQLNELKGRADNTRQTIHEVEGQIASEKQILGQISELLDQKKTEYLIGGKTYTHSEVTMDADDRMRRLKSLSESLALQNEVLKDLNRTILSGEQNLDTAHQNLEKRVGDLARLEAQNTNADLKNEVARLTSSLDSGLLSPNSELDSAFQNYNRRSLMKDLQAETKRTMGSPQQTRIDYSTTGTPRETGDRIRSFLDDLDKKPVPASPESAERPTTTTQTVILQTPPSAKIQ